MSSVPPGSPGPSLIHQASRAALWNGVLRPVQAVLGLAFSVLIRRQFGLLSGIYDVLIGLTASLSHYSSAGVQSGLVRFLPEADAAAGRTGARRLLRDVTVIRLGLLGIVLVPLNIFADPVARLFDLGPGGAVYVHVLGGLVLARAIVELMAKTLDAFFAQLWTNLLSLTQSALNLLLVGAVLVMGFRMTGVLGALVLSSAIVAILSIACAGWQLRLRPDGPPGRTGPSPGWLAGEGRRFLQFTSFNYVFHLTGTLMGSAFAAPALALVVPTTEVALFATAFKLAAMTVGLVVAVFQNVYRPLFVHVRIRNDLSQLQRTFLVMSKAQLLVLWPAGLGLVVMAGDYTPLLFGNAFQPAVPLVWVLAVAVYAATAFNLPAIILSVDEQYRAIAWTRVPIMLAAPVFLGVAWTSGVFAAACVFGAARLVAAVAAYWVCRRLYGIRFPWVFAARIGAVALVMGTVLVLARSIWPTSLIEAVTLTLVGALVFLVGVRLTGVLGRDEVELLERTALPGHRYVVAWLAPHGARGGAS